MKRKMIASVLLICLIFLSILAGITTAASVTKPAVAKATTNAVPKVAAGTNSASSVTLAGTKWKLAAWSVSSSDPSKFTITAAFDGSEITGKSAVNNYGGPFTVSPDGACTVGMLRSTMMAGPEEAMNAESNYIQLLVKARKCAVSGTTLTLSDENGNVLLEFTKEK